VGWNDRPFTRFDRFSNLINIFLSFILCEGANVRCCCVCLLCAGVVCEVV
jgi:hypothetical protein